MSIVKEAFDNHARYVRRGFKHGRSTTVGASEIGQCARKTWYNKHGAESDPEYIDGWGAARRGSIFESKFFVPALRKHYGKNLLYAGSKQIRLVHKKLSATPDGLLVKQPRDLLAGLMVPDIGLSGCVVIDCKTIDPRVNLSEPKMEHVFQIIVQMGMFRLLTKKYKPDYGVLIYTNASFFDDTTEFVVRYDHKIFQHALERANQIMISSTASDLQPEGWIAGGKECGYCPFASACRSIRGDVPDQGLVTNDPQFVAEMRDLAREERELYADMKATESDHRELQEKIKVRLREKGLSSVKDSGISIVWSAVKGRISYDMPGIMAAATAAGINVQRFETVGEPTDRLTVSVSKQDRLVNVKRNMTHGE